MVTTCSIEGCGTSVRSLDLCSTHYFRQRRWGDPLAGRLSPSAPLSERLWPKVAMGDGCWEWTGSRTRKGYGRLKIGAGGRCAQAHRVAWELTYGPVPEGLCVLHDCDNPPCCNPDHLHLGTNRDNAVEREQRFRGRWTKERAA